MDNPIVARLLKSRSSVRLKESMLLEADADEEYAGLNDEEGTSEEFSVEDEGDIDTEIEDDSTAPEQGTPDDAVSHGSSLPSFDKDMPEEGEEMSEEPPVEEEPETKEAEHEYYENPLDNNYAVRFTLGDDISLTFEGDTHNTREGVVDGYDAEGFYRVRWADGTTTNGLTDIALQKLVTKSNECVCGSTHMVNEGNNVVCDRCGRVLRENATLLSADKDRPKGKKLIRSEAHPMSTAVKPSITESDDSSGSFERECDSCGSVSEYTNKDVGRDQHTGKSFVRCKYPGCNNHIMINSKSLKDRIKEALAAKYLKESDETEEFSVFDRLKEELDNEFWTRQNELISDIEELGYTVEEINGEYVVVSHEDEEDDVYQIPIGGTARTMTLDFSRARIL